MRKILMGAAALAMVSGAAFAAGPQAPVKGAFDSPFTSTPDSPGQKIDATRMWTLDDCKMLSGESFLNCEKQVRTDNNRPLVSGQNMGDVPLVKGEPMDQSRTGAGGGDSPADAGVQ